MYNQRIDDDEEAVGQIIETAVARATTPGQGTTRNAGTVSGAISNLTPAPTTEPITDEIGIDADGVYSFPFVLGIDNFQTAGAYLVARGVVVNYRN